MDATGEPHTPEPSCLVGRLVGFLVVAAPLATVAWRELSKVLTGHVTIARLRYSVAIVLILIALAYGPFLLHHDPPKLLWPGFTSF